MKQIYNLTITFILLLYSCNGCKDDCSSGNLQFDLPLQAYGIKDTIYLGDTLRIKLDIPDKLAERYSGYLYDFINYNFQLITYIGRVDSFSQVINAKTNFEWTTIEGESEYNEGAFSITPIYYNHVYHFDVMIMPKRKGLFVFSMNSIADRHFPLEKLDGPCSKNTVHVFMKLINDSNTNFDFLKLSSEPAYENLSLQRFEEFGGFCFFVR